MREAAKPNAKKRKSSLDANKKAKNFIFLAGIVGRPPRALSINRFVRFTP
jgi:hypothetical protein